MFHILKNEKYELCFLAGFFTDEIMTGKKLRQEKKGTPNLSRYSYVVVSGFLLWFPPNLSCLQNNPPEINVEPVPTKSELPPKQSFGT
jgi:hypothetical protein